MNILTDHIWVQNSVQDLSDYINIINIVIPYYWSGFPRIRTVYRSLQGSKGLSELILLSFEKNRAEQNIYITAQIYHGKELEVMI